MEIRSGVDKTGACCGGGVIDRVTFGKCLAARARSAFAPSMLLMLRTL